jgi:hypothetical protein
VEKINKDNYEAFLLDYSERTLSAADLAELKAFALSHPELEIELEESELPYLSQGDVTFESPELLKKSNSDVLDEKLFDYVEGNLSSGEIVALEEKLCADPELRSAFELLKKTVFQPEAGTYFEDKMSLVRSEDDLVLSDRVISYFENTLPFAERTVFEQELIVNQVLKDDLRLVSSTRLVADLQTVYPTKEILKKTSRVIALFNWRIAGSLAAAILLMIGFAVVFNYYATVKQPPATFAKNGPAVPIKPGANNPIAIGLKNNNEVRADKPTVTDKKDVQTARVDIKQDSKNSSYAKTEERTPAKKEIAAPELAPQPREPIVPEKDEKVLAAAKKDPEVKNDTTEVVTNHYTSLEEIAEVDELEKVVLDNEQKGFWKRAVSLAKKANAFGLKAVDGQEESNQKYRLSFNSFSVEKK